jgi:hypothetical protein
MTEPTIAPAVPGATPNVLVTLLTAIFKTFPSKYAKYLASDAGLLIAYLQAYGATWHLVPAVTAIAAGLGVLATPNAAKLQ